MKIYAYWRGAAALLGTAALALLPAMAPQAQEAAQEDVVEEIIVTGVARPTTKFESSASVTALSGEDMRDYAPRSTAEVLRNIPGIQAESSSGDANANVKVRGMPISSGGARYVSFQEDGFPMLLNGDDAIGAHSVGTLEVHAIEATRRLRELVEETPRARAVAVAQHAVSVTGGLDYDALRLDAEYGGQLTGDWTYHVGGFFRSGEGPRDARSDIEEGYQVKATVARQFDRGGLKFHFKRLDDTVPTYLPIPAQYDGGGFNEIGVNFGDGTLLTGVADCAPRRGNQVTCDDEGFQAEMTSIAVIGDFDLNDIFNVGVRHRTATIEGNFASPFLTTPFVDPTAGPSQEIVFFNTQVNDMDNSFTELTLTGEFEFVTATLGYSFVNQNLSTTWNFNQYYVRLDDNLTPFDSGNSVGGVLYGNPAFGNCCTRAYDFDIDATAPYLR